MKLSPLKNEGKGYTRRLNVHFNFGSGKRGGKAASYIIVDPDGVDVTGIHEQYDTREDGLTGFFFAGIDTAFDSWWDAVAFWPTAMQQINNRKARRNVSQKARSEYKEIHDALDAAERGDRAAVPPQVSPAQTRARRRATRRSAQP
jgi:hypothetical protein